jgi:hypothetical protein
MIWMNWYVLLPLKRNYPKNKGLLHERLVDRV